jgi:ketosteroid isomerase-like protein
MKKILIAAVIALATTSFAPSQTKSVEQTIMQIEQEWVDAYVKRDAATLTRILATDFMDIDTEGKTQNKMEYIDLARNPVGTFESITTEHPKVRVYGSTAVLTGRYVIKGTNREQGEWFRYTAVYVKQQGRWRAVTLHSSALARR